VTGARRRGSCHGEGPCGRAGVSVLGTLPAPPAIGALVCALVFLVTLVAPGVSAASEPEQVSEAEAIRVADRDPNAVKERELNGPLAPVANMNDGMWEVAYFAAGDEVALVIVDPESGEVTESWTGYQVAWKMARGYSGSFGHKLNAPYVFLPLCLIFLVGLVDWRRLRRVANLDLLVLLGFGASHFFFNRAEIGVSVPLQYPVLLYLLGRALWIGFRGRGEGLRPVWPVAWMLVAALFLMGFRVGLNLADSGAIDVGYASVVGADRVTHGEPVYDNFPDDVSQGDTYGPVNYYAYVPSELIWPWSGSWDDLPAAHGAAVAFDIATFLLLILLGLRIRPGPAGRRLAAILAFGWAAYPYTAFALESNSNDTLVAALLVATLLVLARPIARGALASLATFAKFAPALLLPMLLTYKPNPEQGLSGNGEGVRERRRSPRPQDTLSVPAPLLFAGAFLLVSTLVMLWPAIDPGLETVFNRTIGYQSGRDSPFSIWGQIPSLEFLRIAILAGTAALSLLLAFRPKRKSPIQVAALGAALLISLQLTMQHWFYLYIVWFYPLLLIATSSLESSPDTPPNVLRFSPESHRGQPQAPQRASE
jgi:glycosyl transferase family 87